MPHLPDCQFDGQPYLGIHTVGCQDCELAAVARQHLVKTTRRFVCLFHIVSLFDISLGINLDLKGPFLDLHLPFGFLRVGWQPPNFPGYNDDRIRWRRWGYSDYEWRWPLTEWKSKWVSTSTR